LIDETRELYCGAKCYEVMAGVASAHKRL